MKSSELFHAMTKNKILPLYYFYGPEKYLIEEAVDQIKSQALGAGPQEFNFEVLTAGEAEMDNLLFSVQALPVNSPNRLVIIRQADILVGKAAPPFIEYFRNPNPSACVVFIGEKVDLRLKFFQALEERGAVVSFYPPDEKEITRWMQAQAQRMGFSLSTEGAGLLLERIGPSLQNLKMELPKLGLYTGKKKNITQEDILDLISDTRSENPFELSRWVIQGEWGEALRLLRKILQQGEPPVLLLSLILRQMRLITKAQELQGKGYTKREIEKALKILPRRYEEFWNQVKGFPRSARERLWSLTLATDRELKFSRTDKGLVLENYLWELCLSSPLTMRNQRIDVTPPEDREEKPRNI